MSEDIIVQEGVVLECLNEKVDLDGGNYIGSPLEAYIHEHCGGGNSANKDLSNLTATGQAKFDAKANKSDTYTKTEANNTFVNVTGDTMTGDLKILSSSASDIVLASSTIDYTSTTAPSAATRIGGVFTNDKNSKITGCFQNYIDVNGNYITSIYARRSVNSVEKSCGINVCVDKNGNAYTYAPTPATGDNSTKIATTAFVETKLPASRFDGQWVRKGQRIAEGVSLAVTTTATTIEYDLASYLPNDSYKYEVMVSVDCATGAKAGSYINGTFSGTGTSNNSATYARVINVATGTSFTLFQGGNAIIPIGTNRKLGFLYTVGVQAATINSIHLEGYRRIGTNA